MKFLGMLVLLLGLAACAGVPRGAETAPDTFAMSLTIVGSAEPEGSPMESAWYVVEPDGVLRVATGERLKQSGTPPRVRLLSAAQLDRLWREVQPWRGWPAAGGGDRPEEAIGATALAYVQWGGEDRRSYRLNLEGGGPGAEEVRKTVGVLRELAWMAGEVTRAESHEGTE